MFQILLKSEVADFKFTLPYFCIKVTFNNLKTSFVVLCYFMENTISVLVKVS